MKDVHQQQSTEHRCGIEDIQTPFVMVDVCVQSAILAGREFDNAVNNSILEICLSANRWSLKQ